MENSMGWISIRTETNIREMAVAVLGELPTVAQLESVDGEISKWLERPPENAARQIVATMLDGFKQKPSEGAAIFLDAMIYILGDMPAAAIAAATREVWETEDWAPSIHAFVDLCKKHRSTLSSVRRDVDLILKKRKDLGEIMALIELDPTGAEQMAEHKRVEEMTRTLKRRERNETI
jgi:hypothetical protein